MSSRKRKLQADSMASVKVKRWEKIRHHQEVGNNPSGSLVFVRRETWKEGVVSARST